MSDDKELAIVRELIEATKQDRLHWQRLVDPTRLRFLSSLPTGRTFVLSAPRPHPLAAFTGAVLQGSRLQIRDKDDRLVAEIHGAAPLNGFRVLQDPISVAVRELLSLVRSKDEDEIDEVLGELRHLKTS